ncbi:hypothetical protein Tco_1094352 [Tanacetum coccineum]|uniref:Tf2-1-like SH3-like domain-containing protein n=1 Tax=Tanacetum coccineum TaxID=301880 RepID=A0ABQ5IGL1_9ASTR
MDVRRIEEEVDPDFLSDAHSRTGPAESGDSCESKGWYSRMRELVVKYKAEKVCHEEIVKMPLVDLKVLEDGSFRMCIDYRELSKIDLYLDCHQMRVHKDEIPKTAFWMRYGCYEFTAMPFLVDQCTSNFHGRNESARVAFKDEFGAAEEREVSCEAQQGQSGVKRKLFGSCRNNMGDVRTLIMEEAHATKYSVRPGVNETVARHGVHVSSIPDKDGMYIETDGQSERTFRTLENMFRACVRNLVVVGILTFREAEIGESKMIGLELEQETTKVVVIKERPKEAKDRVVRFDKKGELAPRYIGPFDILERIGPVAYRLRLPDELSLGSYLSGERMSSRANHWKENSILRRRSIEMSRFSTDSTRSDSASKESIPGGIEWMPSSTSSLIRSTLVEAISSSWIIEEDLVENDKILFWNVLPRKNGTSP